MNIGSTPIAANATAMPASVSKDRVALPIPPAPHIGLAPEDKPDTRFEMEVYARFMRHLRDVPNSRNVTGFPRCVVYRFYRYLYRRRLGRERRQLNHETRYRRINPRPRMAGNHHGRVSGTWIGRVCIIPVRRARHRIRPRSADRRTGQCLWRPDPQLAGRPGDRRRPPHRDFRRLYIQSHPFG